MWQCKFATAAVKHDPNLNYSCNTDEGKGENTDMHLEGPFI